MFYSSYFLAVRSSLKLHSLTLAFESPSSFCQWELQSFHSFIKLLLYTLEPYLVQCNLPLLTCWALIFLELSIKKLFSLLSSFNCKFTSIPLSLIFSVTSSQNNCWNTDVMNFQSTCQIIDSAISAEDFSEDKSFVPTFKMKWSERFVKNSFI